VVRSHLTGWVAATSVIVLATAVAFALTRSHKTPTDFFLPPATETDSSADLDAIAAAAASSQAKPLAGASRSLAPLGGRVSSPHLVNALPRETSRAAASAPIATEPVDRKTDPANRWTPWGVSGSRLRNTWSSASSGAAALGGLWHAMSPFARGGGTADTPASTTARVEKAAAAVAPAPKPSPAPSPAPTPKPSPAPSPTPSSAPSGSDVGGATRDPGTGSSGSTPNGGDATGGTPPTSEPAPGDPAGPADPTDPGSGLGEDNTPLPDLGGGGSPAPGGSGGSLGGGSGTGGGLPSGGDLSATPEPSTIALVGTGLLGLIGVLNRRRRM